MWRRLTNVGPVLASSVVIVAVVLQLSNVGAKVNNFRKSTSRTALGNCSIWPKASLSEEKLLIHDLLTSYSHVGRNGRPVLNSSTVMNVSFGLGLIQMDLDEKYKVLKMSMWSRYQWRDEYLTWTPADYGGITKVRLASNLIWMPDIMLYNSADPKSELRDVLAVVQFDGAIFWVPHQIFKSSCSVDVTNFPFDYQNCHMWFGSWTHPTSELDVQMAFSSGIDLSTFQSDYLDSSDWHIEDTKADKKIMPSANDTPNFSVLMFQLHMKRKLVFSSYILTLPCVFLACLTLVVFWLPPDRPDRTALAMSIFASFLVLLLILVEAVPATASSVPLLGVYYCFNLVIIMMSVFLSSLVVNVCRAGEGTHKVPRWLKLITIDGLGKVLLVSSSEPDESLSESTVIHNSATAARLSRRSSSVEIAATELTGGRPVRLHYNGRCGSAPVVESGETRHLLEDQMREMRRALSHIRTSLLEKGGHEARTREIARSWRDVALVLDRLFFIMYIILIVVSLITLFPRPK